MLVFNIKRISRWVRKLVVGIRLKLGAVSRRSLRHDRRLAIPRLRCHDRVGFEDKTNNGVGLLVIVLEQLDQIVGEVLVERVDKDLQEKGTDK